MSVTAMYVELLVIGLGGLIWTTLFIFCGHNDELRIMLSSVDFKNSTAVIIPFILSAAYVLGILIDKASKGIIDLFKKLFKILFKKILKINDSQYEEIIIGSDSATTVLNYMRSKVRIMRGYILNWLLIGIAAAEYLKRLDDYRHLSSKVFDVSIALAVITLMLYIYNEILCNKRIKKLCNALKDKPARRQFTVYWRGKKPAKIMNQTVLDSGQS